MLDTHEKISLFTKQNTKQILENHYPEFIRIMHSHRNEFSNGQIVGAKKIIFSISTAVTIFKITYQTITYEKKNAETSIHYKIVTDEV